ncbi:unnamed protein product [Paramecium octaurelia]|uniref:Uncharacterized protein n=1 Tax=Paramecium octaurelia TaxID=43137 RepID=A0A8S1S2Z2_PAROT|nr:unnamed protein product [Paramecium octaurelia]
MNHRLCVCKYRNPIEFVCTLKECTDRRLICKSCAWDHKRHDSKVLQINEFETMITNDSLVQRIQDVQNAEGINNTLDQLIQIAQTDIMQILKKRCTELKDKVKKHYNPFNRTVEHITNISKKYYNSSTIDSLVKELDISDIQGQLQKMEAAQFQKFSLICKEILNLSDALDKLRKACQEDASPELKSIRNYIQSNLEFKEVKPKISFDQDLNEYIEKSAVQLQKQQILEKSQLQQQKQQQQVQQTQLDYKRIAPQHMYLSHLEIQKQPKQLSEKASPYNQERLKTEHVQYKSLLDYSFMKEDKSQQLPKYHQMDYNKRQEEPNNQFNSLSNTDRLYPFYQRQSSQSLYQSSKK